MVQVQRIPLFPLDLVLFPTMHLPLHIFELRYRRMIQRCIEENEEFGIILHTGESLTRTGCTAEVEGVIKKYEDGRFDILARGNKRFRVHRFFEEQSHLEAEVQFFQDEPAAPDELSKLHELSTQASQDLMSLAALEDFDLDGEQLQGLGAEAVSLLISSTGLFSLEDRQSLLETHNTRERLERAVQRIKERLKQLRAEKKLEELLGGKINFSSLMN